MEVLSPIKDWLPFVNIAFPIIFVWMWKNEKRVTQLEKEMLLNNSKDNEIKTELDSLIYKVDAMAEKINTIAMELKFEQGKNAK